MSRHGIRIQKIALALLLFSALFSATCLWASDDVPPASSGAPEHQALANNEMADRIFYREAKFVQDMKVYTPMVETYIQDFKGDDQLGQVPTSDKYFIGRLVMKKGFEDLSFQKNSTSMRSRFLEKLNGFYKMNYVALGFMQMVYIYGFDQQNYDLKFLHQEFLGDIRTLVFDVSPKANVKGTHFSGRIWVEDQDYTIVRFNGTYLPQGHLNFFFPL